MIQNALLSFDTHVVYNIFEEHPAFLWGVVIALLLAAIWIGSRGFMTKKKTNQKLDKRTLAGKAYDLAKTRMLPLMKKQMVEFGHYSGYRSDEELINHAYIYALDFSEPPALAKEMGLSVDKTNSREFYLDIYEHQLRDVINLDDAKVIIDEALHFARYLYDVKLGYKGENIVKWEKGEEGVEYFQPFGEVDAESVKQKTRDFNSLFYRKYAIFKTALTANGLVTIRPEIQENGISNFVFGRGSIPQHFYTLSSYNIIREQLDYAIKIFFVKDIERVTHSNVIAFCKQYLSVEKVLPKYWMKKQMDEMNQSSISR